MKIYCNVGAENLFCSDFLISCIDEADFEVYLEEKMRAPNDNIIHEYINQAYCQEGDFYQYYLKNTRKGIVLGEAEVPFRNIKIYCDNVGVRDPFVSKMMQEVIFQLARYRFFYLNKLLLHASVVVTKGTGIAFIGHSGAGKSTQSRLWVKHRKAYILNDDKPLIHFSDNKTWVSGTPWSGKSHYYLNETHELKALCIVEQSNTNKIKRISIAEAYSYIYLNNLPVFLNKEIEHLYEKLVLLLCESVPVYLLQCLPDKNAVKTVENEIFGRVETIMKIKTGFTLRKIADEWLVIAKGENSIHFNSTILLNEVGAFLWNMLSSNTYNEENLVDAVLQEYDVDVDQARNDIHAFLLKVREYGVLEEM